MEANRAATPEAKKTVPMRLRRMNEILELEMEWLILGKCVQNLPRRGVAIIPVIPDTWR